MFRRIRNFVSRHPKKITAVAVIAVGTLAWKFARRRFEQWQENESRRLMEAARKQQHFEATLRTADSAMIALGPAIARAVNEALDTSDIVARLRELRDKKGEEWRAAWAQLKELVICRVVALVYSQALLCVLLRPDLDESQLATCQSLITSGVPSICRVVASAVARCPLVTKANLGQHFTLEDIERMLWSVQTLLCEDPITDPLRNIPRLTREEGLEVRELLGSDEVWSLASSCVSRGLAHTVDSVASFYTDPSAAGTSNDQTLLTPLSLPLAKVIPILDGVCRRAALDQQLSTGTVDFLKLLASDEKLKTLSANIYEAFGDTDLNHNPRFSN
ncbi:hypothetical protein B566_EDAN015682 [Ephemera danica]|nr:hypothetical protein B566_EDAN015682 [Ephemera danica]